MCSVLIKRVVHEASCMELCVSKWHVLLPCDTSCVLLQALKAQHEAELHQLEASLTGHYEEEVCVRHAFALVPVTHGLLWDLHGLRTSIVCKSFLYTEPVCNCVRMASPTCGMPTVCVSACVPVCA